MGLAMDLCVGLLYEHCFAVLIIVIAKSLVSIYIYLSFLFSAKEDINSVSQAFELATLRALKGYEPEGGVSFS